jgi:small glutamine-rich tetratricopeptide repeat-containing protein alpha
MADVGHVVFAILKFLDDQQRSPDLSPDAIESLEVATQCLESAYGISIRDIDAGARFPLPASLPDIFVAGLTRLRAAPEASVADREIAEKLKTEGNELMRQEQYAAAIDSYTRAIETDGRNAVYYCNRAAAYGKLNEHQKSIEDCCKALELDPKYGKAYGRMGLAHTALGHHSEARQCYQKALTLDPTNETYRENLRHSEQFTRDEGNMGSVPGAMGGLNLGGLGGLDLSSLLSNPALMNMATSMLANPQMQQMMANMMANAGGGPTAGAAPGISSLLQAGQQLAQQMQQSNPELVEQLRSQMRGGPTDAPDSSSSQGNPPDGSS